MQCVGQNLKLNAVERLNNVTELTSFPRFITLSITNVCQQRCRFCGYNHGIVQPAYLPADVVEKMNWIRHAERIVLCGNGEVLMHPEYVRILRTVREMAPETHILVYTNGLGLTGETLESTVKYADSVHVSQNAVREAVYKAVIYKGNYKLSMENLKNLARLRRKSMRVILSLVALHETIPDIENFIDLASDYGFQEVRVLTARAPQNVYEYALGKESFEGAKELLDLEALKKYACAKNVEFAHAPLGLRGIGVCEEPFTSLHYNFRESGEVFINYCCNGSVNMSVDMQRAHDIDVVWNNPRVQFVRSTVNHAEKLMANKMCTCCRAVNFFESKESVAEQLKKFRVPVEDGRPLYFPLLHME